MPFILLEGILTVLPPILTVQRPLSLKEDGSTSPQRGNNGKYFLVPGALGKEHVQTTRMKWEVRSAPLHPGPPVREGLSGRPRSLLIREPCAGSSEGLGWQAKCCLLPGCEMNEARAKARELAGGV